MTSNRKLKQMKLLITIIAVIIFLPITFINAQKIESSNLYTSDYGEYLNKKIKTSFTLTKIVPFDNPTFYKYYYNYRSEGNVFMLRNPEYKYNFSFPNYNDSFNPTNAKNIQEALAFGILNKLFYKIQNKN